MLRIHNINAEVSKMDIAYQFHETGVKLYKEGRGSEAFDLFYASIEVQMLSLGRTMASLDLKQRQSHAFHESIAQALKMDLWERSCPSVSLKASDFFAHEACSFEQVRQMCTTTDLSSRQVSNPNPHRFAKTEDPYIFDKIFRWKAPECPHYEHCIVYLAMTFFNMALILQKGFMNHNMRSCLERAMVLYNYAGELLWRNLGMALIRSCPWGVSLSTLYCAVLNNTGYLMHQMGRYDWSEIFYYRLNGALEVLEPAESLEEQSDRDTLQLNVIVRYGACTAAASA
jgi:hypothetical protein